MNRSLVETCGNGEFSEKDVQNLYHQTDAMLLEQDCKESDNDIKEKINGKTRKRGRHGARNQHRHKYLVKWIVKTFPNAIKTAKDNETSSSGQQLNNMHVLDVAGGKGELAARLTLCHQVRVMMIDPRPADILNCFHKLVFRSLPKKWQEKITSQDSAILENAIQRRFHQHVMYFPSDSDASTCIAQLNENKQLLQSVKDATLLIGMHSDGATESIVDVAMHYRKPFMVVPCCVFPNLFHGRFIPQLSTNNSQQYDNNNHSTMKSNHYNEGELVPVRSHEQFCKYLLLKDSHFVMETLPFEGRNIAIWWDGLYLDTDKISGK